jgi:hypothetical protein
MTTDNTMTSEQPKTVGESRQSRSQRQQRCQKTATGVHLGKWLPSTNSNILILKHQNILSKRSTDTPNYVITIELSIQA